MIKPVLKIELPKGTSRANFAELNESLQATPCSESYYVLLIIGNTDYVNIEIITASDVNLHKDKSTQ